MNDCPSKCLIGGISFSTCVSIDNLLSAVEIGSCITYQGKYCNCESLLKKDVTKSDGGGIIDAVKNAEIELLKKMNECPSKCLIGGISFSTCRSLDDLLEAVEIGNCITYQGKYCNCESLLKKDALKSDSGGIIDAVQNADKALQRKMNDCPSKCLIGGVGFSHCVSIDNLISSVESGVCSYQGRYCDCESLLQKS